MAKLKSARSRTFPSSCSLVRMAHTCLGSNGGLGPTILPLFHACLRFSVEFRHVNIVPLLLVGSTILRNSGQNRQLMRDLRTKRGRIRNCRIWTEAVQRAYVRECRLSDPDADMTISSGRCPEMTRSSQVFFLEESHFLWGDYVSWNNQSSASLMSEAM